MEKAVNALLNELEEVRFANTEEEQFWEFEPGEAFIDGKQEPAVEIFLSNAAESEATKIGPEQISAKIAMDPANPDYPRWVEADDAERLKLVAYECWRKLSEDEMEEWRNGVIKAVPTAVIYTRKRCGKFKARCVVLGDRWEADGKSELYAGTVAPASNRMVLVECAARKWVMCPYDVGNAFIRAPLPEKFRVAIRLPCNWREKEDPGVRLLRKAMYGLPISPRLWSHCYADSLKSLGFTEAKIHSGVWIKRGENGHLEHMLTVYVDDCILISPSEQSSGGMIEKLNKKHPLSRIKATKQKTESGELWETWDVLGCDVSYCREKGELKFSLESYLKRLLASYGMESCKTSDTPGFEAHRLHDENQQKVEFPLRQLVGSLQWAQASCRPDLTQCTNALARVVHKPAHIYTVACAKRVLRYVKKTLTEGISYSPEEELKFEELYRDLSRHPENERNEMKFPNEWPRVHSFADASFASTVEFKSVSGMAVYYRGCPIAWKSSVQTVASGSTYECEWIAQADMLLMSREAHSLDRFMRGKSEVEMSPAEMGPLWCDSRSVLIAAKKENLGDIGRKSRHMAIRMNAVREHAERLAFVPTNLQRADGLTKGSQNPHVYELIFRAQEKKKHGSAKAWEKDPVQDVTSYALVWGKW